MVCVEYGVVGRFDGLKCFSVVGLDRVVDGVQSEKEVCWHAPLILSLEVRLSFRFGGDDDAPAVPVAFVGVDVFLAGVFGG